MPSQTHYVVGIDLGTTHCALAASAIDRPGLHLFKIPQLIAPGEIAARPLLPSFLYLPASGELALEFLKLPWGVQDRPVGELAQLLGARVPRRLVSSAKSWICHGGVNRRAPVLPWNAPDEETHISAFDASVAYMTHLRQAWDHAHPEAPLANQEVVVTIPASFDEVARGLTIEIAQAAGLRQVRLLEEPQAAFYDFLGTHQENLATLLQDVRLILVVDVGGGTTDLTLLRVTASEDSNGLPRIERLAVGGHLLLGGDNMDAALAHHVQQLARIKEMDATEWSSLVQSVRWAKERLLSQDGLSDKVISIQQRGSRLIGNTLSVTLQREDVERLLLQGFFPQTRSDEIASRQGRAGLTTLGLPYTSDPAIPRHICTFLRQHVYAAQEAGAEIVDGLPKPDRILLNGGVFNASMLAQRLASVIARWYGDTSIPLLSHTSLDTAVARGAARFALGTRGLGLLISGGSARAYYMGIADKSPQKRVALCIAPRGMEEGTTIRVEQPIFDLLLGRLVTFPIYSYSGDREDAVGTIVDISDELELLPPLETTLSPSADMFVTEEGRVPVTLTVTLNTSGALEIFLVTVELPPKQWRLDFSLTGAAETSKTEDASEQSEELEPLLPKFADARLLIQRVFGEGKTGSKPEEAKQLRNDLERLLGPRGEWSLRLCRELGSIFLAQQEQRARSNQHERAWLHFVGWCLRPGMGMQGDLQRMNALWQLHDKGMQCSDDKEVWSEWWMMWRRVSLGLDQQQQAVLFADAHALLGQERLPPGTRVAGHAEMLRLLAALELLTADQKTLAGQWVLKHFKKLGSWWPLGRLGTRQPFRGKVEDVVPTTVAEDWLTQILAVDWSKSEGAAFAAVLLARMTGDSSRDINTVLRTEVVHKLKQANAPSRWMHVVNQIMGLSPKDTKQLLGDSLPTGLQLR